MKKIALMTDSNSGITQNEGKKLGIRVLPMPFTIDGEEYLEDINLNQDSFYEKLIAGGNVSTSQPAVAYLNSIWDELLEEYDEVVYIPMSSGLSKSCESALNSAARDYAGKVFVVDNKRISVTQRQAVLDAMKLVEKGYSGKEIHDILIKNSMNSDIFIMVDTLEYLKKGGRITPAAAALGGLLRIKPILMIKGDKLDKYKMKNRTVENAKRIMLDSVNKLINGYLKDLDGRTDNVNIAVAYTGTDASEARAFSEMIKQEYPNQEIIYQPLSLSVSCHIGPGSLAIAISKDIII